MLNKLKGWKTIIFNISALIVVLANFSGIINPFLPVWGQTAFAVAVPVANLILRYYTTGKIFGQA